MLTKLFFPHVAGVRVERLWREGDTLHLEVVATRRWARCPLCQRRSRRVHSSYERTPADLPCVGDRQERDGGGLALPPPDAVPSAPLERVVSGREDEQARRQVRYAAVQELRRQGLSITAVAHQEMCVATQESARRG